MVLGKFVLTGCKFVHGIRLGSGVGHRELAGTPVNFPVSRETDPPRSSKRRTARGDSGVTGHPARPDRARDLARAPLRAHRDRAVQLLFREGLADRRRGAGLRPARDPRSQWRARPRYAFALPRLGPDRIVPGAGRPQGAPGRGGRDDRRGARPAAAGQFYQTNPKPALSLGFGPISRESDRRNDGFTRGVPVDPCRRARRFQTWSTPTSRPRPCPWRLHPPNPHPPPATF